MIELAAVLYWASFLLLPILVVLLAGAAVGRWWSRLLMAFLAIPVALLTYGRFIEPKRLIRVTTPVELCGRGLPGTLKAAVVSDMHQGIFHNAPSIRRIVGAINRREPDLVLIPGDFTYGLKEQDFAATFAAFKRLEAPAYAVMGNHDHEMGTAYTEKLIASLEKAGVTVLAPGEAVFRKDGKFLQIVGLRDAEYAGRTKLGLGDFPTPGGMPSIVISHNPDVVRMKRAGHYDLMVAGHTHGGQIWIPPLTCRVTGACKTLRYGLAETQTGQLFVTSGTGMVGLPMRFNVQPRIDYLDITIDRCEAVPFENLMRVFPHNGDAQ